MGIINEILLEVLIRMIELSNYRLEYSDRLATHNKLATRINYIL